MLRFCNPAKTRSAPSNAVTKTVTTERVCTSRFMSPRARRNSPNAKLQAFRTGYRGIAARKQAWREVKIGRAVLIDDPRAAHLGSGRQAIAAPQPAPFS